MLYQLYQPEHKLLVKYCELIDLSTGSRIELK